MTLVDPEFCLTKSNYIVEDDNTIKAPCKHVTVYVLCLAYRISHDKAAGVEGRVAKSPKLPYSRVVHQNIALKSA